MQYDVTKFSLSRFFFCNLKRNLIFFLMNTFTASQIGLLNNHKAFFQLCINDVVSPRCPRNMAFDTRSCLLQADRTTYYEIHAPLAFETDFPQHLPKEPLCYLKLQRVCLPEETSKKDSP